jgi:hypothetical protein
LYNRPEVAAVLRDLSPTPQNKKIIKRSAVCCAFFLWAKELNARDIHKEMFLVYDGLCLSHKGVHNWVKKFSHRRSKVVDDDRPGEKVAETTVKNFYAAGFDVLVKECDKCINVGGGYVAK